MAQFNRALKLLWVIICCLLSVCNEKAEAVTKQQCAIWDKTTHVKISAQQNNCAAFKRTGLKYINRSLRFGRQLSSYPPKKENPQVLSDFFHDLNVFGTVVMLWPIVFLLPNWENHEKDHNVKLCSHAQLSPRMNNNITRDPSTFYSASCQNFHLI